MNTVFVDKQDGKLIPFVSDYIYNEFTNKIMDQYQAIMKGSLQEMLKK